MVSCTVKMYCATFDASTASAMVPGYARSLGAGTGAAGATGCGGASFGEAGCGAAPSAVLIKAGYTNSAVIARILSLPWVMRAELSGASARSYPFFTGNRRGPLLDDPAARSSVWF